MNIRRQSVWLPKRQNEQMEKVLRGEGGYSICFWDLECTNLSAMIGRILCCSFLPLVDGKLGKVYTLQGDKDPFVSPKVSNDAKLVIAIRDELEKYDIIVGHNSKLFDRKFLNGRLLRAGTRPLDERFHVDTMWTIRSHMRVSSKLANVQEFLHLEDKKTPITWEDWADAAARNSKAMREVVKHCEQDVKVLHQAYWKVIPYIKNLVMG